MDGVDEMLPCPLRHGYQPSERRTFEPSRAVTPIRLPWQTIQQKCSRGDRKLTDLEVQDGARCGEVIP
jgi:hypothetical protein